MTSSHEPYLAYSSLRLCPKAEPLLQLSELYCDFYYELRIKLMLGISSVVLLLDLIDACTVIFEIWCGYLPR